MLQFCLPQWTRRLVIVWFCYCCFYAPSKLDIFTFSPAEGTISLFSTFCCAALEVWLASLFLGAVVSAQDTFRLYTREITTESWTTETFSTFSLKNKMLNPPGNLTHNPLTIVENQDQVKVANFVFTQVLYSCFLSNTTSTILRLNQWLPTFLANELSNEISVCHDFTRKVKGFIIISQNCISWQTWRFTQSLGYIYFNNTNIAGYLR